VNRERAASPEMDVRLQKTFDYAIDVTKQILTLGTAVLALTVTVGREAQNGRQSLLLTALAAYFVSVIGGILTLFALMTEFSPRRRRGQQALPSIGSWRVRGPSLFQIVAFAFGTAFLVLYAYSVYQRGSG
jgi:Na+/glutamate symporter